MKRIPIGLSNFKHLIEEDFYYFDKTKFIDEIIQDGAQVKLFTRPRRFGKTLNMSMLKYFFDIKEAEENRKIFKDLYIEKTESFKEQGQYPVIFLSLKDLKARTWEIMEKDIKSTVASLFSEYKYLLKDLDKFDTITFENVIMKNIELENLKEILKFLTKILYEKYNKKVIVLVDEYDSPLVSAYTNGYYEKVKNFFKTFYSTVLKDNTYLQMGIWSILNFLQDKELRAYWVDTSGNDLINNVLKMTNKNIITALERLFNGNGLKQNLSGTSDLSKILSDDEVWELLLFSGYLTVEEKINQDNYILRLPNKEVKSLFRKTFIETYIANKSKRAFIMEFKSTDSIEKLEEISKEALQQIEDKKYNVSLKQNGIKEITYIGIAFCGKQIKISYKSE